MLILCFLPWVDDSVQDSLHSGGDTSGHHLVESVQEGDRVEVGDDTLVFWDQHDGSFTLPIRYVSGDQNVIDSVCNNIQDDLEHILVSTSSY